MPPLERSTQTSSEDLVRSRRQRPVARQNSTPSGILSSTPIYKEPVRSWPELPSPFKPHPFAKLQPTSEDQIAQIDQEWATYRHRKLIQEKRANGEETCLETIAVELLSETNRKALKRKRALAEFKTRPLESQIPMRLPAGINNEVYLSALHVRQQCEVADDHAYRTMEGLPPSSQYNEQQMSEEQQVQLLLHGPSFLQLNQSAIIEQIHDQHVETSSTSEHHWTSSHLPSDPSESYLSNFENDEYFQSALDAWMHTSPFRPLSSVAEQMQTRRPSNQDPVNIDLTVFPQQTVWPISFSPPMRPYPAHPGQPTARMAQTMPPQTFVQSPSMMHNQSFNSRVPANPILIQSPSMAQPQSPGNTQPSISIISGSQLLGHDEMLQKQRKEAAMKSKEQGLTLQQPIMNTTMAHMAQQQASNASWISEATNFVLANDLSFDKFRLFCQGKQFGPHRTVEILQHPALVQWRSQKQGNYVLNLREQAQAMVRENISLSKLLMFGQRNRYSEFWLKEILNEAKLLGWDFQQKKEDYRRGVWQLAQEVVNMGMSWDDLVKLRDQRGFAQPQFKSLLQVLEQLGWIAEQKFAETQQTAGQQQQRRRTPSLQVLRSPFEQKTIPPAGMSPRQQRERSLSLQHVAMMQAMSPLMQVLRSPSQQVLQDLNTLAIQGQTSPQIQELQHIREKISSGFQACMSTSPPEQQAAYMRQYKMSLQQQQQAQQMGLQLQQPFEPTPSSGIPVVSAERGQSIPVYFNQSSMNGATKSPPKIQSGSAKDSTSPYQSRAASPKKSPKKKSVSPKYKSASPKRPYITKESMPPGSGVLDISSEPSASRVPGFVTLNPFSENGPQYQTGLSPEAVKHYEKMSKKKAEQKADAAASAAQRQSDSLAAQTREAKQLIAANGGNQTKARGGKKGPTNLEHQRMLWAQEAQQNAAAAIMGYSHQFQEQGYMHQQQEQQFASTQYYQDNTHGMTYMPTHANFQAPTAPMYPKRAAENQDQFDNTPCKKARMQ